MPWGLGKLNLSSWQFLEQFWLVICLLKIQLHALNQWVSSSSFEGSWENCILTWFRPTPKKPAKRIQFYELFFLIFIFTLELQALRDRHCDVQWNSTINICRGRIFARYDVKREDSIHKWRCYHEVALTGDLRRYDTSKASNCYYTDNKLALEHFQCEGNETTRFVLLQSKNKICLSKMSKFKCWRDLFPGLLAHTALPQTSRLSQLS